MGYSISVSFKTQQEQEQMLQFMQSQKTILDKLSLLHIDSMGAPPFHSNEVLTQKDMGYAPKKKHLLGFNTHITPECLWDLCIWMAVKSSVRNSKGDPFFFYDAEIVKIKVGVIDGHKMVNAEGIAINEIMVKFQKQFPEIKYQFSEQFELMNELNNNWLEFTNKNKKTLKLK